MSKSKATAFAAIASSFIGRMAAMSTADGVENYKIVKLSDQIGSLKDGTKGEYVVLQREGDDAAVITLHPQKAKVLFTKGAEGKLSLLAEPEQKADEAVIPDNANEADAEPKAPSKKALFMEAYTNGVAAGKSRKEIKVDAIALGLSDAGFNTYYQNAKSGKWA